MTIKRKSQLEIWNPIFLLEKKAAMSSSAHFDTRYWCYRFLFSHWKNILSTKVLLWRVICQNCAHPAERSSYTKQPRLNKVLTVVEFCYTFTCIFFPQKIMQNSCSTTKWDCFHLLN